MSAAASSTPLIARWTGDALDPRDDCDLAPSRIEAADSWLVRDGRVLALDLHLARFRAALPRDVAPLGAASRSVDAFLDAAIATIPREGEWFPRIEARRVRGAAELLFRLRPAPELRRSVTLATADGDPRTAPRVKGPDLEAMLRLRTEAQTRGADEAVVLGPEGEVAEGSTSCLAWWRGDALCVPDETLPRVDSVTLRSVLALAAATGVDVVDERARPEDLEGLEVWACNALHGIRIVTGWVDGPTTAEQPGRLAAWRARLDALRRRLPDPAPTEPE